MRKLIYILLLFIPYILSAQTDTNNTRRIRRGAINDSRATHSINQTILKSNNYYDSIGDLRTDILKIEAIFNPDDSTIRILRYLDWELEDGWEMQEGRMGWNDDDKTIEIGLDAGSVGQILQEIHLRSANNTGDTIFDGSAINVTGAIGSRPTIGLANNDTSITAYTTFGLATQDILDDRTGYGTMIGLVRGLNTSAWPAGSILWLDSIDGGLTDVRPIAPNIAVVMGVVLRSNPEDGVIGVKVISVPRLAWLSDVKAQGAQTMWDLLYWNSDSLRWELNDGVLVLDSAVITSLVNEPPHTALAFADSAAVIPTDVNVWSKVTNVSNNLFTVVNASGITAQGDSITIQRPGDYLVFINLSFQGGPSDQWHAAVYKNGVVTPFEMHRRTSNNDTGNMGLNGYLSNLVTGDDLSFYIRNTGDNDDPTMVSCQFTVYMLHQ